jgi:DNA polymerase V
MGAFKEIYIENDNSNNFTHNLEAINMSGFKTDSSLEVVSLEAHFYGDIQCGFPSPATDYLDKDLNLHDYVVKKPAATFFMRAKGDSMIDAGIFPNDLLVIDRSLLARSGHIVVASLNGELTLKRLSYHFGKPILIPENKNYKCISVSEEQDFQVFGVLTFNIHQHLHL